MMGRIYKEYSKIGVSTEKDSKKRYEYNRLCTDEGSMHNEDLTGRGLY